MGFKTLETFIFTFVAISLACYPSASGYYQAPTGPFATHYHDCCRVAFSYDHPSAKVYAPVDTCQKDGVTLVPEELKMKGKNGCDGGDQFACNCLQPTVDSVDPTLGYAFGAYNIHEPDGTIESACYFVQFKPQDAFGKPMKINKLIIQNINTSTGISKGSWDLSFAGGGVGEYNKGCMNQWGTNFGQQYGGVDSEQACCSMPIGLRSSCLFRYTLFGGNPELVATPQRVRCPKGIIDRSGSQRQDDAQAPVYSGKTDETGQPAPDRYQRNRSVCQNVDPLGVVNSVCGGGGDGGRLPKGTANLRRGSAAAGVVKCRDVAAKVGASLANGGNGAPHEQAADASSAYPLHRLHGHHKRMYSQKRAF